MVSRTPQHRSLGGILLLAILMVATVALAIIGTLEEKSSASTSTPTVTQTQPINTTQTGGDSRAVNTSTTTLRI